MLVYKLLILFLILFLFVACYKPIPHLTERTGLAYYYLLVYQPEEIRKQQCSQPNAILTVFGGSNLGCINGKVTNGLIFDSITNQSIAVETLKPSQSFLCKCNASTFANGFSWERGVIQDNPPSGVSTTKIFNSYDNGHTNKDALIYKTHYNQEDNLYCIPGGCGFSEYKYQFLKIR